MILKNFADQSGSMVQTLNEQIVNQKKVIPVVINKNVRLEKNVDNNETLTRKSKSLMDESKEALQIWEKETYPDEKPQRKETQKAKIQEVRKKPVKEGRKRTHPRSRNFDKDLRHLFDKAQRYFKERRYENSEKNAFKRAT